MKFTYEPPWKRITKDHLILIILGIAAGLSIFAFPFGMWIAMILAVFSGFVARDGIPDSMVFIFAAVAAVMIWSGIPSEDPALKKVEASTFGAAFPLHIIWVIPMQWLGLMLQRLLKRPFA